MCGIAGIFNFRDGSPPDRALIELMTDRLRHRGPDDRGFLATGPVALGMRRLSIIDLEGGAQPIGSEDRSVHVVCNGEIYNHKELRRELEGKGHSFRTRSDTEVIVHGYEEFGTDVLEHLNGMFALALWDSSRRRLFLARDRLGIKPLYYTETSSGIVFASELKAILQCPDVRTQLDPVALQQYFSWEYIPTPRTPFLSVQKLPPASYLLVNGLGVSKHTYWQIQNTTPVTDEREAAEGLRWHLARSVRLRREADVPIGAFLSGGLDSSAIVATLAENQHAPVHTFSIGFAEDEYSEAAHARSYARSLGTVHEEKILRPDCLDLIEEVSGFLDEPFADSSILPTYLVSKLARGRVKVVLSGDGGDELFGGYDHYKADRLAGWYTSLPAPLRRQIVQFLGNGARGRIAKRGAWRRRLRQLEEGLALPAPLEHARWMVRCNSAIDGDLLGEAWKSMDPGAWMEPWSSALRRSPFGRGLTRQLYVDVHTYLTDDILFKVDRASMAVSLEARVPYLDHELVEYAFRIPDRWKLRWLAGKWILRRAFQSRLPPTILRRRKSGFDVPIGAWLRNDLYALTHDILSPSRLRRQGYFQADAVTRMLGEHTSGQADHSRILWALIIFQLWSDQYGGPSRSKNTGVDFSRDRVMPALGVVTNLQ
jgi:asparagine synthase (glutamine-hydrolysing)